MSFLAVVLVADPKVPVDAAGGVGTDWSRTQPPSLPVLSLRVLPVPPQPLGDHLAGGPFGGETLEPGQSQAQGPRLVAARGVIVEWAALDLLLVRMEPTIFTPCCLVSVCSSRAKLAAVGEVEPGLSSEEEERKEWVAACCRNSLIVLSCRNVVKLQSLSIRSRRSGFICGRRRTTLFYIK